MTCSFYVVVGSGSGGGEGGVGDTGSINNSNSDGSNGANNRIRSPASCIATATCSCLLPDLQCKTYSKHFLCVRLLADLSMYP